jgi:2-oxoglutarate ferredoxin oxidoreductase subunit alpha
MLLDLDIGMNEVLCEPFEWDDSRRYDRGKVMSATDLDSGKTFGRYLDVDGDGIPWRTIPGTHPTKGAFFSRGTTRNAYAKYSEAGTDYVYNMERLRRKFETAKKLVPAPVLRKAAQPTRFGAIYYGSTSHAMSEAAALLKDKGVHVDLLRVRAFPFADEVTQFIDEHDVVFVVEQNESGQLRMLLLTEGDCDPKKLVKVLHYDGTPITAGFISGRIASAVDENKVSPIRKVAS